MATSTGSPRYNGLDSLRAVMMLLGIYLHAAVANSYHGGWPFKDERSLTHAFDMSLSLIHSFRMPVFFVMAGFFGALLYARRGWQGFAWNRAKRVLFPFLGGWLVLFPVVATLTLYGRYWHEVDPWNSMWGVVASGKLWPVMHPMHLWFLEYLSLFCGAAVVMGAVVPAGMARVWRVIFHWALNSPVRPLWFAIPTFFTLLMMRGGGLDDPPGFLPVVRLVLAYGVFFTGGWFLYENVHLLGTCQRHVWAQLTFCLLLIPFSMWYEQGWNGSHNTTFFVRAGYHAVFVWCLTFSLIGLFQQYLDRPMTKMRYLSDSSYFLYLVHMPVLIVIQLGLLRVGGSPVLKCFILLAVSVPVMLVLYHYLVRPTVLGLVLNGRKYPRKTPGANQA